MSKTVLVIDDDWTIQQALRARLSAHGYLVALASDGPAGLRAAQAHCPQAILLDLRMPDMDGFEVLRRLRAMPELASVPVIFLTANIHDTVKEQARAAGASGFLTKPYEASAILELIGEVAGSEA
jgi:two-component system chemotaxis response regulator CheY